MLATSTFLLCLLFTIITRQPNALPPIFPLTYHVRGINATLHDSLAQCSNRLTVSIFQAGDSTGMIG